MNVNEMILDTIKTSAKRTPKYYMQLASLDYQLVPCEYSKRWEVKSQNGRVRVSYCKSKDMEKIICYHWARQPNTIIDCNHDISKIDFVRMLDEDICEIRDELSQYYRLEPKVRYYYSVKQLDGETRFYSVYDDMQLKAIKRNPNGRTLHKFRNYPYNNVHTESICELKEILADRKNVRTLISDNEQTIEMCLRKIECAKERIEECKSHLCEKEKEIGYCLSDARFLRESRKAKVS